MVALNQDEIARRMNDFQEMIEKDRWDAGCIDEAYAILKSYTKRANAERIGEFTVGDAVTFAPGRRNGPSIVRGKVVRIGRTRIGVREGIVPYSKTWNIPAWAVIDHELGVEE